MGDENGVPYRGGRDLHHEKVRVNRKRELELKERVDRVKRGTSSGRTTTLG